MADFAQALTWLKEGKKVRLPIFSEQQYIYFGDDYVRWENGTLLEITNFHVFSSDWQIFEEPKQELVWEEGRKYKQRNGNCLTLTFVSPFIKEAGYDTHQLYGISASKYNIYEDTFTKNGKNVSENDYENDSDIIGYWED